MISLRPDHPNYGRREALLARVLERVEIDEVSGCWIWTGPTSGTKCNEGYPRMSLDGQTVSVHRVTAMLAFGFLHSRRQVDHTCRNRLCVNPAHLELVTHKQNCRRRDLARPDKES